MAVLGERAARAVEMVGCRWQEPGERGSGGRGEGRLPGQQASQDAWSPGSGRLRAWPGATYLGGGGGELDGWEGGGGCVVTLVPGAGGGDDAWFDGGLQPPELLQSVVSGGGGAGTLPQLAPHPAAGGAGERGEGGVGGGDGDLWHAPLVSLLSQGGSGDASGGLPIVDGELQLEE